MATKADYSFLSQVVLDDISKDPNRLNSRNPSGWLQIAESSGRDRLRLSDGIPQPTDGGFAAINTKSQSQIVLRGAHMNEKSDSMEKKSTPTPGARTPGARPPVLDPRCSVFKDL